MSSLTSSGAILTIDLDAIRANYRLLQRQASPATCGAVVKADAYGLGAAQVAPALADAGCRHFFVAHVDEGIALRASLPPEAEIIVMHGLPSGTERDCLEHRLIPVLNNLGQIRSWRQLAQLLSKRLPAIIQFDTGMSRMGLSPPEVERLLGEADVFDALDVRYLMSHLACAEQQSHPMNQLQLDRFTALRARFPKVGATLANSSGVFLGPAYQFDLARPGAALYGLAPVAGEPNPMAPVVRLQGRVLQTRTILAGDHVGYGSTWRADDRRLIVTVAVGYADGWPRSLGNRGMGFIDDIGIPIVGMVSMDTITLDASGIDEARLAPGALVDLIGPAQPADAVAALAGTIGYEILTSLGPRYHRVYLGRRETTSES